MIDFISPLRVVDIALAWLVVETIVRYLRQQKNEGGQGPGSSRGLLANALAGFMLLLALRTILADWETVWFLVFMTAAGSAHLLDVWGTSSRFRK